MKVCLYAVRVIGGWGLEISLDLRVDLLWWGLVGKKDEAVEGKRFSGEKMRELVKQADNISGRGRRMVVLSEKMPLGLGTALIEKFVPSRKMDGWSVKEWAHYIIAQLSGEPVEMKGSGNSAENDRFILDKLGLVNACMISTGDQKLHQGSFKLLLERADEFWSALEGRQLLEGELQQLVDERLPHLAAAWRSAAQLAYLQGRVQLLAGVGPGHASGDSGPGRWHRARKLRCRRCGSEVQRRTPCGSCGLGGCAWCEACLALGRSRDCALLLRGSARAVPPLPAAGGTALGPTGSLLDRWGLSPAQREAARAALRFLAEPEARKMSGRPPRIRQRLGILGERSCTPPRFLLWAVTGAGKTEMIFPLLSYVLERGGRVLVATPRRDVILELAPRIAKAFPHEKTAVLYGGSSDRWEDARLILATTHQLMRFYQAFDLVVVDELDAFPYHNDPILAYAAESACKPMGKFVFLSATPPRPLLQQMTSGRLPHAKVPARYHGYPLPIPSRIRMNSLQQCLNHHVLPGALLKHLQNSIHRGAQIFVFVSRIHLIPHLVSLLRKYYPQIAIDGTSSQDHDRGNKVMSFRRGGIRVLVTTTILERGVTVPRSDVYILDADCSLFDEASLVQMAGRAGRSKDDPAGSVLFASYAWTKSQQRAIQQINQMNRIAERSGYLRSGEGGEADENRR